MTPEILPVSYAPWLVAVSFLVSAVGAYAALVAAGAARKDGRRVNRFNVFLAAAMVAATAALWLAFNTHKVAHRVAAALVMASAVCTMHYTGMAAASVVCTTVNRRAMLPDLLRPADLPVLVMIIGLGVAAMVCVDLLVQRLSATSATPSSALSPGREGRHAPR